MAIRGPRCGDRCGGHRSRRLRRHCRCLSSLRPGSLRRGCHRCSYGRVAPRCASMAAARGYRGRATPRRCRGRRCGCWRRPPPAAAPLATCGASAPAAPRHLPSRSAAMRVRRATGEPWASHSWRLGRRWRPAVGRAHSAATLGAGVARPAGPRRRRRGLSRRPRAHRGRCAGSRGPHAAWRSRQRRWRRRSRRWAA